MVAFLPGLVCFTWDGGVMLVNEDFQRLQAAQLKSKVTVFEQMRLSFGC